MQSIPSHPSSPRHSRDFPHSYDPTSMHVNHPSQPSATLPPNQHLPSHYIGGDMRNAHLSSHPGQSTGLIPMVHHPSSMILMPPGSDPGLAAPNPMAGVPNLPMNGNDPMSSMAGGNLAMAGHMEEEPPLYVNAKQYHRILKRRSARAKLEEALRGARQRKPYLHESRHKHAMRRPRGPGGRFLTKAELEELEAQGKLPGNQSQGSFSSISNGLSGSIPQPEK